MSDMIQLKNLSSQEAEEILKGFLIASDIYNQVGDLALANDMYMRASQWKKIIYALKITEELSEKFTE